ncbi:hypothetical protein jhhlp_001123 [Lomentospora prolificans]|uniref:YTH domain-containing protein n=1 Tax=Lomentospora prolificans TaxID=41688 RepID=A0A2N3NH86_9PEZI|nr:hypothetical protein jhhlp_001123 [Lomentospora prolificans]
MAERPGASMHGAEEAASTPSSAPASEAPPSESGDGENVRPPSVAAASPVKSSQQALSDGRLEKERYFILKSLTVEDLEMSVRNGIWATQSHNEETLNAAFKSADSVYLFFSANKSGEYFGYAKMTSAINEDPAAAIEFAPSVQSTGVVDLPKAIPTDMTEYAPKGRIIDDSARGTIFWEIERGEESSGDEEDGDEASAAGVDGVGGTDGTDGEADGAPKSWGKPFTLEWLSTARVPFYRTRGLRNPWNANREVKIARDGTELEPSVGRRLIGLFNMIQSPGFVPPGLVRPGVGAMRYPQPHTRPYS